MADEREVVERLTRMSAPHEMEEALGRNVIVSKADLRALLSSLAEKEAKVGELDAVRIALFNRFSKAELARLAAEARIRELVEGLTGLTDAIYSAMRCQEEDVLVNGVRHPGLLEPMRDILRRLHRRAASLVRKEEGSSVADIAASPNASGAGTAGEAQCQSEWGR